MMPRMSPRSSAAAAAPAIPESDPVWQAFLRAPVEDWPIPEEEVLAMEEARRSGGASVDGTAVSAEIGRGFLEYLDSADAAQRSAIEQLLAEDDPVMRALARAPLGPPDPPVVRAAIELGQAMGAFVPGSDVTVELVERRRACEKAGP